MSTVSRGNKGEALVLKKLKKLDGYYKVINNFTYFDKDLSHQVDHVLIHPHGIFVIETKNYYGTILAGSSGDLWYKVIKGKKQIISNPIAQNKSHCKGIRQILDKKYYPISLVVYPKNNAPYMDDENIINLNDLLTFILEFPYDKILENDEIDLIYKTLKDNNQKISKKEHIANVKKAKEKRDNKREEMRYAIEEGKCPKCDAIISIKGYTYYCEKCGYKFTL